MLSFGLARVERRAISSSTATIFSETQRWGFWLSKRMCKQGVDGSELGEEEQGHHRRAADRQPEPNLVAPSELHQADEVFHVSRDVADGKTQRASMHHRSSRMSADARAAECVP